MEEETEEQEQVALVTNADEKWQAALLGRWWIQASAQ
jgi:hypothetical protein